MSRYSLSTLFKQSITNSKYWGFDFIGQFLVAARSVRLFGNKQNVSSSGAQNKQSSNYAVGQQ